MCVCARALSLSLYKVAKNLDNTKSTEPGFNFYLYLERLLTENICAMPADLVLPFFQKLAEIMMAHTELCMHVRTMLK